MNKPFRYKADGFNIYRVYLEGGGVVPKELSGGFTKKVLVEAAIDTYVTKRAAPKREYRKSRGNSNGKRATTTG